MIICWGGLAGADYAQKMIICWGDLLVLITRLENIRLMYRPTERTYQAVRTRLKNIRLKNTRLKNIHLIYRPMYRLIVKVVLFMQ